MKCAVGLDRPDRWPVRAYHRFLVWDITRRPRLIRALERALNPLLGKSLVLYAVKPREAQLGPPGWRPASTGSPPSSSPTG